MEGFLNGAFMSFVFLVFLIFRRKKFDIPLKMMILIHIVFTVTGAFGASLGAALSGLTFAGKRLHLLMAVDSVSLTAFCWLLKKDRSLLGDYMAPPVVAVCAAAKVGCVLCDCCYGLVLFQNQQGLEVRFPSAIVELSVWILLVIALLLMEKKGQVKGLLWPIGMIWFGILRFLVDFFRGAAFETKVVILGLPAGRFWSLLVLIMGVYGLIRSFQKYRGHTPTTKDLLCAVVGRSIQ